MTAHLQLTAEIILTSPLLGDSPDRESLPVPAPPGKGRSIRRTVAG